MADSGELNWGGNHRYMGTVAQPTSIEELQSTVSQASHVRARSTRHSFNDSSDGELIVDLQRIPQQIIVDPEARTATVRGAVTYGALIPELQRHDLAVHNLASLPHISVAGAVSTGTHGSGDANGNLATAVSSIELVLASGDAITIDRTDPRFNGSVVNLGALGVVVGVTLDLQPAWTMRQQVYEDLDADAWAAAFDETTALGESVSAFTRWGNTIEQLWVKASADCSLPETVLDAPISRVDRHPIREMSPDACTPQGGVVGSWADRLPHFKLGFTPSAGDEIQSEFFVAREHLQGAAAALRSIEPALRDVLLISEVRTVAADDLWMSPHQGRDSVAFHFTWALDPVGADAAAVAVWEALLPFGVRAHWGKVAPFSPRCLDEYERVDDHRKLASELDPSGVFRNAWYDRIFEA